VRRLIAITAMAMGMTIAPVAHADEKAAPASPEESFVYENEALGLCYDCLRVRIAVLSGDEVTITRWRVGPGAYGHYDPTVSREHVSRARIRRFLKALARYRPAEAKASMPSLSSCSVFVTETGGLTMLWNDASGQQKLYVWYGCDPPRYKAMFDALHHAPDLLGLGDVLQAKN